VNLVPQGFLNTLPMVPRDGTLLQEIGSPDIHVIYAGAHFLVPGPADFDALGLDWGAVRPAPAGALASLASVPREGSWLKEVSSPNQYVILRGGAVWLEPLTLQGMLDAGRLGQFYLLPDGAMQQVPATRVLAGDADCDGGIDARDALQVLRRTAGLPNLGVCATIAADVNCDGAINSADALLLLRYNAGLSLRSVDGCRQVGT